MAKENGLRMKANMTLPPNGTRKEVPVNGEFNALDAQEARDLYQRGRADYVEAKATDSGAKK